MLEFRTGSGLRFTVLIDRGHGYRRLRVAGQIDRLAFAVRLPGIPACMSTRARADCRGMRSFSGLMVTCGLDHILFMYDAPADNYVYGLRGGRSQAIHPRRVGTIPARLTGYGERWEGDRCILWAEGRVRQATGLLASISNWSGGSRPKSDPTRSAFPTRRSSISVSTGPRICIAITSTWRIRCFLRDRAISHRSAKWSGPPMPGLTIGRQNVGYRTMAAPINPFHEQVWQHEMTPDASGEVPVALVNDALGFGFEVTTRKDQFPCMYQWQKLPVGALRPRDRAVHQSCPGTEGPPGIAAR